MSFSRSLLVVISLIELFALCLHNKYIACLAQSNTLNHNNKQSKAYMVTCGEDACQDAISLCVNRWMCLGVANCKQCLSRYPECISTCATDLFNEKDYITVNREKYLPCDDKSPQQIKACELNCRGYYFRYSECTLLDGLYPYPVCRCSSHPLFTTTSSYTTTTTAHINDTNTSSTIRISSTNRISTTPSKFITLTAHEDRITSVVQLNNDDLATASSDRTIKIWNLTSYQTKRTINAHNDLILCMALLKNGNLASGSMDTTIRIWNPSTGEHLQTLRGHAEGVYDLKMTDNGYLLSSDYNQWSQTQIKIWEPNTGALLKNFTNN
jgi:WD40 repeat protein